MQQGDQELKRSEEKNPGSEILSWASLDFVDTCLGRFGADESVFGLCWGFVVQRRVQSLSIVKHLDVFEYGRPKLEPTRPDAPVDQFDLERREKRLCDGVVPAIALATHADFDAELGKSAAVFVARVLSAPVGMMK